MRILVITQRYPMCDRAAGDFRLFQMLKILASRHHVACSCYAADVQARNVGASEVNRYRDSLVDLGIEVEDCDPLAVMRRAQFDMIMFEFHFAAGLYLGEARVLQKRAVKIIDSVDVAFNRLFAKARLTGLARDVREAKRERRVELKEYRRADHVIVVSDEDRRILSAEDASLSMGVVPTIHPTQALDDGRGREADSLLFVGNFLHEPNTDAVMYFCEEVLPLIWREVPTARLRIIGAPPPDKVRRLAEARIEVLGHVPDLQPYLRLSRVSVAPLRFGGGVKGKVGEALAAGLPVVTTPTGAEGIGLVPGRDALVASNAQEFSAAVVRLLRDQDAYESVRKAGWKFVTEHFSVEAVAADFLGFLDQVTATPARQPSRGERLKTAVPANFRHALIGAFAGRFK